MCVEGFELKSKLNENDRVKRSESAIFPAVKRKGRVKYHELIRCTSEWIVDTPFLWRFYFKCSTTFRSYRLKWVCGQVVNTPRKRYASENTQKLNANGREIVNSIIFFGLCPHLFFRYWFFFFVYGVDFDDVFSRFFFFSQKKTRKYHATAKPENRYMKTWEHGNTF